MCIVKSFTWLTPCPLSFRVSIQYHLVSVQCVNGGIFCAPLQTAAASVKKATDKLISMASRASTHIEVNPQALMAVEPTASLEQFRLNSLRRIDPEAPTVQNEMSRAQRMLAKIQLE